jgi:hypothetical protein
MQSYRQNERWKDVRPGWDRRRVLRRPTQGVPTTGCAREQDCLQVRVRSPKPGQGNRERLLRLVEEVVVGGVGNELSLPYRTGGGRSRSASGIQALDEGYFGEQFAAREPLLIPNRLQQETLNGAIVRATRVGTGVDVSGGHGPHLAAIEGTLPGRVAAERYWVRGELVGIRVDAGEVRNDLDRLPECVRKEGGFGTSGVDGPGRTPSGGGQADIALTTQGMAEEECSVSLPRRNVCGSGWRCDSLRRDLGDRAESTRQGQNSYQERSDSRSPLCLLNTVADHFHCSPFCFCDFKCSNPLLFQPGSRAEDRGMRS